MYLNCSKLLLPFGFIFSKWAALVADIMTKPLKLEVFQKLQKLLGVCDISGIN